MRVLVCGGRNFNDRPLVFGVLDGLHAKHPISLMIHGGQTGADSAADAWAFMMGVRIERYPVSKAQWNCLGRKAGPLRNQRMLEVAQPELVVAFPGGKGTADMMRRATWAGVKVLQPVLA